MHRIRISKLLAIAGAAGLLGACRDGGSSGPTAADRLAPPQTPLLDVSLDPFTYRATIDPYRILRLPDFMIQQHTRSDIVIQRIVLKPGPGAWHTTGPHFVYVIQGQLKRQEFSDKEGCTESVVHGPGDIFAAEGDHPGRPVVVSSENAVVLVTRFNIPIGSPILIPVVPAPPC